MPDFSVIITTYNRPQKVLELVNQLLNIDTHALEIIVVDSSDTFDTNLHSLEKVNYIHSNHKNQPYQRFLGHAVSTADYLLFLDDDMEIVDPLFLTKIKEILLQNEASGLALNFKDKHQDTTLNAIPKSRLFKNKGTIKHIKNWFTGLPDLPIGILGLCGNRGKQADTITPTQYVGGGAFVAKRSCMFQNFNFQLFDLYEEKLGKGEDAMIGYGLHKLGTLLYIPDIYFLHNDQRDSTYSMNIFDFGKRVLFSRLFLSLEKTRLDNTSLLLAKLHFHWYALWRLSGLFLNYMLKKNDKNKVILSGTWEGWKKASSFAFDKQLKRTFYWQNECELNLQNVSTK